MRLSNDTASLMLKQVLSEPIFTNELFSTQGVHPIASLAMYKAGHTFHSLSRFAKTFNEDTCNESLLLLCNSLHHSRYVEGYREGVKTKCRNYKEVVCPHVHGNAKSRKRYGDGYMDGASFRILWEAGKLSVHTDC